MKYLNLFKIGMPVILFMILPVLLMGNSISVFGSAIQDSPRETSTCVDTADEIYTTDCSIKITFSLPAENDVNVRDIMNFYSADSGEELQNVKYDVIVYKGDSIVDSSYGLTSNGNVGYIDTSSLGTGHHMVDIYINSVDGMQFSTPKIAMIDYTIEYEYR